MSCVLRCVLQSINLGSATHEIINVFGVHVRLSDLKTSWVKKVMVCHNAIMSMRRKFVRCFSTSVESIRSYVVDRLPSRHIKALNAIELQQVKEAYGSNPSEKNSSSRMHIERGKDTRETSNSIQFKITFGIDILR